MHNENINAPRIELSPKDLQYLDHKQYTSIVRQMLHRVCCGDSRTANIHGQ